MALICAVSTVSLAVVLNQPSHQSYMMAMHVSANHTYVKTLHYFMLQKMAAKDHVLDPAPQTWLENLSCCLVKNIWLCSHY